MSNQLSSLGKRKAGWATHWTLTQHPKSSNSPPDAVSWHHPSPPDGDLASSNSSPNGDMASSNSRPNGDPGSSHSRPDGDPWTSNSPPLLRDTPTDPQAATREGKLSTRLAALSLRCVSYSWINQYLTWHWGNNFVKRTLYTRDNATVLARSAGNLSALCRIATKYA